MAAPTPVTLDNYSTLLVQSTQGRAGVPDGNIYFNKTTGEIEIITLEELATVDLGAGLEPNPLTDVLGVTMGALYAFERQERAVDEELRAFDLWFRGNFKFAGAYDIVNGRKFASTDRNKVRASGWAERAVNGNVDRIYFGPVSLGNVEALSQPFYQLVEGGVPADFAKTGPIDEAIQVYGSTANGDAGAGNFDLRTFLSLKLRTFGFNFDEKRLGDSGISAMDGYSAGFAIGETPHLTTGSFDLVDVYGGAQIAPWTGMSLEKLAVPQTETGFTQIDGDFSWVLANALGGTLNECVAFLDALAQTDDDIDSGSETVTLGKRVGTWYTYDAQGRIVTRSGADSLGLFIENIPISDQQRIVFRDDAGLLKTYPFFPEITFVVGGFAAADPNAWYHAWYLDGAAGADYNTTSAVTVNDKEGDPIKGLVAARTSIVHGYAYETNTQAGLPADEDKDVVVSCEGDGGATQAKTVFTITKSATISVTVAPGLETNM